uniref:Ge1_WD40 domain-containing protein n=1 Tax=Panagrellus redivivus TaxID=6233 RepID=A0A7E4VGE6_PANRE
MALSPHQYHEKHSISVDNEVAPFAIGKNVLLHVEKETHPRQRDSSRASSRALCEYKWDSKETGRILSARGRLVAYRLQNGLKGEVIRILDRKDRSRHLIKDFRALIVDLQWAHHRPLVAVADSDGSLYIYDVEETCKKCDKYLNVIRDRTDKHKDARISWCPYIPEPDGSTIDMLVVTTGKTAHVINITRIKAALQSQGEDGLEITADAIKDIPGGIFTIDFESNVTIARISPDSSALVVAEANGLAHFYVVEDTTIRLVSKTTPIPNQHVEDIVFFDNLTVTDHAAYWRYAAISSDNGQRITVFDCDNWDLVAKLRFELPAVTKLEIALDLTAKYLFVFDLSKNNVFCVEIAYVNEVPHFASATMIAFFNTLYIACPVSVVEEHRENSDLFGDDDGESGSSSNLVALLVAICPRSLLEIDIDLEQTVSFEPVLPPGGPPLSVQTIPEEVSPLPSSSPIRNIPATVRSPPVVTTEGLIEAPIAASVSTSALQHAAPAPVVDFTNLIKLLNDQFGSLENRISTELQQVNYELQGLRSQSRSDLETAMEHITNEFRNRNEQLETLITSYTHRVRDEVVSALEDGFSRQAKQIETHNNISHSSTLDVVRNSILGSVVPSLDRLAKELFQQFSDNVAVGVNEFNDRLAKIQNELSSAASTPKVPDTSVKVGQLLDNNEIEAAFELALTHRDHAALTTIISRVDLEAFFGGDTTTSLRLPYILVLFDMLVQKLNVDTALKLQTLELLVAEADLSDPAHKPTVIATLEAVVKALEPIHAIPEHKRSARVIRQLAMSAIKSVQSP